MTKQCDHPHIEDMGEKWTFCEDVGCTGQPVSKNTVLDELRTVVKEATETWYRCPNFVGPHRCGNLCADINNALRVAAADAAAWWIENGDTLRRYEELRAEVEALRE